MKGFRRAEFFLSVFFCCSLTCPVLSRTVDLGTLNPEQTHTIYDQDTGSVDIGLNPSSGADELVPGVHTLGLGRAGAEFQRSVRAEAADPRMETLLMIVTGLGLVAFQMRRVQRLLHHRPFSG